jgi:hypothetical protein
MPAAAVTTVLDRIEHGGLEGGGGRPGRPPARATEEGMEPDDLLCSRNARPPKALVGRAQWKIDQPTSLKNERTWRDYVVSLRSRDE